MLTTQLRQQRLLGLDFINSKLSTIAFLVNCLISVHGRLQRFRTDADRSMWRYLRLVFRLQLDALCLPLSTTSGLCMMGERRSAEYRHFQFTWHGKSDLYTIWSLAGAFVPLLWCAFGVAVCQHVPGSDHCIAPDGRRPAFLLLNKSSALGIPENHGTVAP